MALHDARDSTPAGGPEVHYAARLGTFSGTMLVVGGIIGAGIFLSPAVVVQRVGTTPLTLGAWGLGALIAIIGGFVYAELGARRPRAGGTYVYLREAFGTLPAFLYGWALFLIIGTGAIAAVAMTGANYLAELLGLSADTGRPMAIALIVGLTALNILGVRIGATTGNVLTILKLSAIALLVVAALLLVPRYAAPVVAAPVTPLAGPTSLGGAIGAMGAALVPVLFSFGGWQQTNAVAEELVDPQRTLPRALILGVLIVAATYLLVNIAYLRALGLEGLAASRAPAADAMQVYLGPAGRTVITFGIVTSTVGFLGMVILMSARVYQAMAADGLFFRSMARLHPRTQTPVAALVGQGLVALVLLLSGTYGQLLDYVVFADWIFFGSTAATLLILRSRDDARGVHIPVRAPWHPFSTLLFVAAAGYVVVGSILSNPGNALRGALLLALGLPVYAYWMRQRERDERQGEHRRTSE
ncbi:amino acid permease [Gemmatimonas aurantiaca]|uniref:APC family permease n=1 Tax=Gemmatimonas aurantiaca TaxID=173480 RepID=UPI00301E40C4